MGVRTGVRRVLNARPGTPVCIALLLAAVAPAPLVYDPVGEGLVMAAAIAMYGPLLVLAGLLVWRRRPGTVVGPAVVVHALHQVAVNATYQTSQEPLAFTAAIVTQRFTAPLLVLAVLAFPGGPLTRAARALVALFVVWDVVLTWVPLLWLDPLVFCGDCPPGLSLVLIRPDLERATTLDLAWVRGYVVLLAALLVVLVGRVVRARGPARRVLWPLLLPATVLYAGSLVQLSAQFSDIAAGVYGGGSSLAVRSWLQLLTGLWLPVGLVVGAYAEARRRERAATVVGAEAASLEDGVRAALGDPSAALVDRRPATVAGRVVTPVGDDAWLSCAAAAVDDRRLLDAVVATARLVLDSRRRVAALEQELADVRASRARLQRADDEARDDVQRRLAAGPRARLQEALASVAEAEPLAPGALRPAVLDVADQVRQALDDLDALARGLGQTRDGLAPALRALGADAVEVPDRRYPPEVEEAAYFVAAEAVANARKHAGPAARVTVAVTDAGGALEVAVHDDGRGGADATGSGLAGLVERVAAHGGRLAVTSGPAGGTTVHAVLPLWSAVAAAAAPGPPTGRRA